MSAAHPFLDWRGPKAFAHRGGTEVYPENIVPAFEHAVSLGYRYLETDVHRSADGVLVAFHDDDLDRTCGLDRRIADLSWDEIAELRVDGVAPIPKMADLLTRWPDIRFNIDCKADDAVEPLAELINEQGAIDRVCVGSFSGRRLARLRKLCGRRLLTTLGPWDVALLRLLGVIRGTTPRVGQVPVRARPSGPLSQIVVVDRRFVVTTHRRGLEVHVWTIDDADEMHRLLDLGVDGLMTDQPTRLREVLVERGAWFT